MKRKYWWYVGGGLLLAWTIVGNILLRPTDTDPTTLSIVGAHVSGATQQPEALELIEILNSRAENWGAENACGGNHQLYYFPLDATEQATASLIQTAQRRGYTFEQLEEGGDDERFLISLMRLQRNGEAAYAYWILQDFIAEGGGILLLCEPA